ncbi:uncharacterized protein LOC122963416 isoform X1 [Acropora millepora]|uniref:uncharacterized protein LOC122963416 isoform X1 n=1 Tax=Acropora millepora TaxID=45264 RepID=UPI001CF1ACA8|nr:uncharacterized protein LOC122963416 isoform X1 [Acropora millepora]
MISTKGLRRSWQRINMADMLNGNCHQIRRNQLNLYQANMTTSSVLKRKPSPIASNRPNAIICKLVRRLTTEEFMAARRRVSYLNADDWGYNGAVDRLGQNQSEASEQKTRQLKGERNLQVLATVTMIHSQ